MSTSNFHSDNATHVFVVVLENEWDYEDAVSNVQYALEQKGYDTYSSKKAPKVQSGLRSYPATVIADKSVGTYYGDVEVGVRIKAVIRSGYYQHANLDWELEAYVGDFESDQNLEFGSWRGWKQENRVPYKEILEDYYDMNSGMATIQSKNVEKWLEDTVRKVVEELETVYKKYSEPYGISARFSNGETWYTKVEA